MKHLRMGQPHHWTKCEFTDHRCHKEFTTYVFTLMRSSCHHPPTSLGGPIARVYQSNAIRVKSGMFFPKQFTVGVLNAVLSVSALAGVLCPPRRACLLSPNLSPNVSPTWLCLSPWLGCCVRLSGLVSGLVSQFVSHLALSPSFVSPFVSHLALSFTLAGVLCPPRWGCLPICVQICLPSGFVSQFCLPICSHLALSFTFRWACLRICLPMCLPSGFVPVLSPNLFPIWLCLSPWLGCCVRLVGLVS